MTELLALVAIAGLATYRLARAVAVDTITEPLRQRVYGLGRPRLSELVSCQHCVGFWLALLPTGLLLAAAGWPGWPEALAAWWGAAGVGSFMASRAVAH